MLQHSASEAWNLMGCDDKVGQFGDFQLVCIELSELKCHMSVPCCLRWLSCTSKMTRN